MVFSKPTLGAAEHFESLLSAFEHLLDFFHLDFPEFSSVLQLVYVPVVVVGEDVVYCDSFVGLVFSQLWV